MHGSETSARRLKQLKHAGTSGGAVLLGVTLTDVPSAAQTPLRRRRGAPAEAASALAAGKGKASAFGLEIETFTNCAQINSCHTFIPVG